MLILRRWPRQGPAVRVIARWVARLTLLAAGLAVAQGAFAQGEARAGHCVIVYASGRNVGNAEALRAWDARNQQFGQAIASRLEAAGWGAETFFAPLGGARGAAVQQMLARAAARGCRRIVDAAVFEDTGAGLLVVRARLHPLLGLAGPRADARLPEIGEALYDSRREFEPETLARLTPARLQALGRELAEGMLEKIE